MDQTPESPSVEILRTEKTPWLALGTLLVVLLVLSGGAFYFTRGSLNPEETENRIEAIDTQSTSTEPEAIEADLAAESPDTFEQDFDAAFAELDASLGE